MIKKIGLSIGLLFLFWPTLAQSALIELYDGSFCLFAGEGATLTFAEKRLNYSCGLLDADQTGLIGAIQLVDGYLDVEKVMFGLGEDGFELKRHFMLSGQAEYVVLSDSTKCFHAGEGATLAFEGKRLNFTCADVAGLQTGLIGDVISEASTLMAERVTIGHKDDGFYIEQQEEIPIVYIKQAMPEVLKHEWRVRIYTNMQGESVDVLDQSHLSLAFDPTTGQAFGDAGCNNYTASFDHAGATLTFGPAASTRKMCLSPEGIMEQEAAYLSNLSQVYVYYLHEDTLELFLKSGGVGVILEKIN